MTLMHAWQTQKQKLILLQKSLQDLFKRPILAEESLHRVLPFEDFDLQQKSLRGCLRRRKESTLTTKTCKQFKSLVLNFKRTKFNISHENTPIRRASCYLYCTDVF